MEELRIKLEKATVEQRPLLGRLMQLYLYEFSEFDNADINKNGLYEYEYFDHYWREKDRFPFLFYVNDKIAGFVLVNSHSPDNKERNTKSIAEFFVMPKYRKKNIGKNIAFRIFDMFPGKWQVFEMESNIAAQKFWRKVIAEYTDGDFEEILLENDSWRGPMQTFSKGEGA